MFVFNNIPLIIEQYQNQFENESNQDQEQEQTENENLEQSQENQSEDSEEVEFESLKIFILYNKFKKINETLNHLIKNTSNLNSELIELPEVINIILLFFNQLNYTQLTTLLENILTIIKKHIK
jgi:hypothetical protein